MIGPPDVPGAVPASETKGLEFDAVLVVEPERILADGPRGAAELYVALTRATQRLGVLHLGPLPRPWPASPPSPADSPLAELAPHVVGVVVLHEHLTVDGDVAVRIRRRLTTLGGAAAVRIAHCGSASVVSNTHGAPGARLTFSLFTNAYASAL